MSKGILFVVLRSCVSVEGHTVCCFTFMCKCRGAYCLLLYLYVQVSRGHTVCCCDLVFFFLILSPMLMKAAGIGTAEQQYISIAFVLHGALHISC